MERERVPFRLNADIKEKYKQKIKDMPNVNSIQQRLEMLVMMDLNSTTSIETLSQDIKEVKRLLQIIVDNLELK